MFDWLEKIVEWLVFGIFNLEKGSHLAEALSFFIYDSIKILLILVFIVSLMGIINSHFPVERVRNYLSSRKLCIFIKTNPGKLL